MPVLSSIFQRTKNLRPILFLALGWLSLALAPLPASTSAPQARFFQIQASDFDYAPSVLRVNPGDQVTIELVSEDVVHGIYLDGYNLEVQADPGQPARLRFVADQPGSFRFRCSVTCGALHPFMLGQLKVGVNWLFWKALAGAVLLAFAALWMARK